MIWELWAGKAIERCKRSLISHSSESSEDSSTEKNMSSRGMAHGVLEEDKDSIRTWDILAKNLSAFCHYPENFYEAKPKSND